MNLLSLIEELLIEETRLEGVIECVRDFDIYAGMLGENKHIVRSHKGPKQGNANKELIKQFNLINKTNLNGKYLSFHEVNLRQPLGDLLEINFTSNWEEIYRVI